MILNVKDKSVVHFMEQNLVGYKSSEREPYSDGPSLYGYMKDELIVKSNLGLAVGECVKITLRDSSRGSQKTLSNIYTYELEKYDDISFKLKLIDFIVELETL